MSDTSRRHSTKRTSLAKKDEAPDMIEPRSNDSYDDRSLAPAVVLLGKPRIVAIVAALAIAVFSFFVLAGVASSVEHHASTIETLDEKKQTVTNLVAGSTGSSAAISLLPGDAGTPIAEKLVDISSDFLIVLAAIYLEKYLLTVLGMVAFKILVPVGCLAFVFAVLLGRHETLSRSLYALSARLVVFGLAVYLVVPASVKVSNMIEDTYQSSIQETLQTAEETTEAIEESAEQGESKDSANPLAFLTQVPDELNKLTESAQHSLNNFIEALAVMIVTSCIIPILVLLFFLWLMRVILGIDIDVPLPSRKHRW